MRGWHFVWDPRGPLGIQDKHCFSCQLREPYYVLGNNPPPCPLPLCSSQKPCIFPLPSDASGSGQVMTTTVLSVPGADALSFCLSLFRLLEQKSQRLGGF